MGLVDFARSAIHAFVQRALWITSKQVIYVIHEEDLSSIASSTDICFKCGRRIRTDSINGLIMTEGQLKPYCDRSQCNPIASPESANES